MGGAGAGGAQGSGGASKASGGTTSGGSGNAGSNPGGSSGTGNASGGQGGASGNHTGKWKVMMLGDSITASTCYPQLVYKGLMSKGHTNFEFVGTQMNQQSCGAMQVPEEGHGGYGVTYLPQGNSRPACTKTSGCGSYSELQAWAAEKPEIVLMHYGTNDVWDGVATGTILSAYLSVVAEFRKQNPNVIFMISKIIKLNPSGCSACLSNVKALADALTDSWASANSTANSPISIVDDYNSGFDPATDASDGVHPSPSGAQKPADATVAAVIAKNYF
jgi:mannan endo-1,4-beta-mannosidase